MYFMFLYMDRAFSDDLKPNKYRHPALIGFYSELEQAEKDIKQTGHYDNGWYDRAFILFHETGNYIKTTSGKPPFRTSKIVKSYELYKTKPCGTEVVVELDKIPEKVVKHNATSSFLF